MADFSIQSVREQYPEYNDLTNVQLADAMWKAHYSDVPKNEFFNKIGLGANIFYGTQLAACVLVFRQNKEVEKKKKILFP